MKWMKSTFKPRQLEAIALRDEHIVFGPFCATVGAAQRGRSVPVDGGAAVSCHEEAAMPGPNTRYWELDGVRFCFTITPS
jgi:hypothetical protein